VHKYIDGHRGLLCLASLKNGWVVGGFYSGALVKGGDLLEKGLIFNLTCNEVFRLKEKSSASDNKKYRGMTYDDYYVIFGNAELRFKTGLTEVLSNLGVNSGYYDSQGNRHQILFG
jgi:hypothetical protein